MSFRDFPATRSALPTALNLASLLSLPAAFLIDPSPDCPGLMLFYDQDGLSHVATPGRTESSTNKEAACQRRWRAGCPVEAGGRIVMPVGGDFFAAQAEPLREATTAPERRIWLIAYVDVAGSFTSDAVATRRQPCRCERHRAERREPGLTSPHARHYDNCCL
jgi:hypothetical protein